MAIAKPVPPVGTVVHNPDGTASISDGISMIPLPMTGSTTIANPSGVTFSNYDNWSSPVTIQQNNHHIQGKMVSANLLISDIQMQERIWESDEIKGILCKSLVEEMMGGKYIEFTKMVNPSDGSHKFHARIFVVPDTQVRILRESKFA